MPEVMTQVAWPELAEIVGKEHLRVAGAADAFDGVTPQMICEPGTPDDLAHALRWAHGAGLKVTPRGGGTKLGWGNSPAACDLVLSTARLNRVLEYAWDDMTVIVEAGCRVADLQKTLAEQAVIDLKPFAEDAKKRMAAAAAEFAGAAPGVTATVTVNELRLLGIAFDDKNLRVVADAKGNVNVAISSLAWQ